ncbi:MAG: RtcB family protein [Flavobacteriales bacterium]|nr:RtcB family protein [Flavobacteriales bacterium]
MKVIYNKEKQHVPIKIWSDIKTVEEAALNQLENISTLPFVHKHVAVMPDVHLGKGATVGSVIATQGALIPAAVGVDLGCGVMAVKTQLNVYKILANSKKIRCSIESVIPVGNSKNISSCSSVDSWDGWEGFKGLTYGDENLKQKARLQLGSLGSGNHFIEICLDESNNVWVMLHSGSRGIGNVLASRHINEAKNLMKKMFITLPDPDLSYLVESTKEFRDYIYTVKWCQVYAFQNRIEMMNRILKQLSLLVNNGEPIHREIVINCHHNYTTKEHHFGKNVWLTRKGAVSAKKGEFGIIPGSMGTKSYIVKGKGNINSFTSCSHGAGRRFSRGEAKRRFSTKDLIKQTEGVECRKDADIIDELPSAYKNIDDVMQQQKDLVEIIAELKQVICVKG